MDGPAFAPAKLRPPSLGVELIDRPKLAATLAAIPERALTLVTAPAGSGKTVAVARWAATAEVPVAWLRLDRGDAEPSRLLAAVLAAVAVARPELRPPSWPEPGASIEVWLTRRLLIPLAEGGGSLVIVLDEAEVATNGPLAAMLEWLLDNRSASLHLCVIGREPPPLRLARIDAEGGLLRIGVDELWFGSDELAALGRSIPGRELERLTRGWPVAARLIARAAEAGRLTPREAVDRQVLDYMIEEIVDRLASAPLLIDTAILDDLEPEVCVAVSGRADAVEQLRAARECGLLHGDDAALRAHPLLREALLRRLAPTGRAPELHRRASRFYADQGRIELALQHGIAGADAAGLATLARERGWDLLRGGQLDALARMIDAVDEAGSSDAAAPEDRRVVAVLRAWATLRLGPDATRVALAQARVAVEDDELLSRSLAALEALTELRGGDPARGLAHARAALDGLGVEQRGLAIVLRLAIALASELGHDAAAALEALVRAAVDAAIPPALPSLATVTAHRVRLLCRLARIAEAIELGESVGARLVELGLDQTPAAGALALELALAELARGRLDAAERAAIRGLERVELGGDAAGHIRGLIILARIRRARGDDEGVARALELARERNRLVPLPWLTMLIVIEERPLLDLRGRLASFGPLGAVLLGELRLACASAWLREPSPDPSLRPELIAELERELEAADAEGRRLVATQARALLAALIGVHDPDRAARLLEQAVAVAEPEQIRGPFLAVREPLRALGPALPAWLAELLRPHEQPASAGEPELLLSERELELLREIARGLSNQLIAGTLHISLATVKTHVHHILAKLEVRNRTQAVHRARSLGLLA